MALRWRTYGRDGVSNHQPQDGLLNRLFRLRSKKTSKLPSLTFCGGIHQLPVNSPHKGPGTLKMFPFEDVIMGYIPAYKKKKASLTGSSCLLMFMLMLHAILLITWAVWVWTIDGLLVNILKKIKHIDVGTKYLKCLHFRSKLTNVNLNRVMAQH